MPMNPIAPRLRVVNGSNDVVKVQLNIAAGDELEVSESVARQLVDVQVGVRVVDDGNTPDEAPTEDNEPQRRRGRRNA